MQKVILKIVLSCSLLGLSLFFVPSRAEAASKPVRIGTAICVNKNGRAVCRPDNGAIINRTRNVIVNGWISSMAGSYNYANSWGFK